MLGLCKQLHSEVPGSEIKAEHLFQTDAQGKRTYNRKNRWNMGGDSSSPYTVGSITHLIVSNNQLGEAAALIADSTVLRYDSANKPITDGSSLLRVMEPKVSEASPNRNSDPAVSQYIT